jgi:hypothetical protein
MSLGRRSARGLVIGLVLAVLALITWALREPPTVDTDPGVPGPEARALAAQLESARSAWRTREAELTQQLEALDGALASEQELRYAREREWLEFTQLVGSLGLESAPPIPEFLARSSATGTGAESPSGTAPGTSIAEGSGTDDPSTADSAAHDEGAIDSRLARATRALDERGRSIRAILAALLSAEQVHSLDFREVGRPHTHEGRGVVGPVVARLVDDRGHLVGGLFAERLWIEVSRSARCVTLVLENGYETRGGVREDFAVESRAPRQADEPGDPAAEGAGTEASDERAPVVRAEPRGVQRIFLPSVDPEPWLEALPEIIDEGPLVQLIDDGVYDLVALRLALNELLRKAGTEAGEGWRLRALGGVQSGVLRDVQLVEHAADGTVTRRLFADRLEVHRSDRAIELLLEKGSQERSGRLAPFLEGRYRVALPRARADEWVAAGVPGAGRTR